MDITQFFEQYFDCELTPDSVGEVAVLCPFHDDKVESMSINLNTGLWKCFGCNLSGDIYTFVMETEDIDFKGAQAKLAKLGFVGDLEIEWDDNGVANKATQPKKPAKTITQEVVQGLVDNLWLNQTVLEFLRGRRGLNDQTIRNANLGYRNGRITIPLRDGSGEWVNIRQYSPDAAGQSKMISWGQGYGSTRLYPDPAYWSDEPILLCEGELDMLLAKQLGYNAVTSTGGAGTWKQEWNAAFKDRTVWIVYDVDDAGRNGAAVVARNLTGIAAEVKILHIPLTEPKGADITDWVVGYEAGKDDIDALIASTQPYYSNNILPEDDTIHKLPLHQASKAEYYNKHVQISAVVAGKDLAPFIVPQSVIFSCNMGKKQCQSCRLGAAGGIMKYDVGSRSPDLLLLKGVPSYTQEQTLKRLANINSQCATNMEIEHTINMEDLLLIPELEWSAESQQYVTRKVSIIDHGIQAGKSYIFTGITVPNPKSQYATHLIYAREHGQDDIATYHLSDDMKERLKVFQPAKGETVRQKLDDIVADLSANVTNIYGRADLHIAIDMCYHSVIGFNFDGKNVKRGWLEVLLFGDTRTGKTETLQQLMSHYQLGEFVTGESSSYAGLVGGLQQTESRWQITWGKIPLNDKRLVAIDEMSGLTEDNIANMSGIRSSGVAEITKIQTERTAARTRLIWISNPREGVSINSRSYPVTFLRTLIGKTEDIARYDLVVTASTDDVENTLINSRTHSKVEHIYTSELCHELLMWTWSRGHNDVFFSKQAVSAVYDLSIEMGNTYSSDIPLIEGADFRVKLARMAVALAARTFSTDDGKRLLVTAEHVRAAAKFVDECYSKPTFKYRQYSEQRTEEYGAVFNNKDAIIKWMGEIEGLKEFLQLYDSFSKTDISDFLGLAREDTSEIVKYMYRNKLVRRTGQGYIRKMPAFINLLEQLGQEQQ